MVIKLSTHAMKQSDESTEADDPPDDNPNAKRTRTQEGERARSLLPKGLPGASCSEGGRISSSGAVKQSHEADIEMREEEVSNQIAHK